MCDKNSGPGEKRNAISVSISHVEYFVATGTDLYIQFLTERMECYCAVGISECNDAIYLGVGITKDENGNRFACIILRPNDYEGESKDISMLPEGANRAGDFLDLEEKFALRSEFTKLMRLARIARPGVLYDASVSARTFAGC